MRARWFTISFVTALSVFGAGGAIAAEQALPKLILSLGNDSYLPQDAIEVATGAQVKRELGRFSLTDFSLVILSDIPYRDLPLEVQGGLVDFIQQGGTLFVTGGSRAYGSGGYGGTDLGAILPLKPIRTDWVPHPFRPTLILQPPHPILQGVIVLTMAHFNELGLNSSGANLIAEYRGGGKAAFAGSGVLATGEGFGPTSEAAARAVPGGTGEGGNPSSPGVTSRGEPVSPGFSAEGGVQGGGRPGWPLIAEGRSGKGTIIATALDLTQAGGWKDQNRFVVNTVKYLLDQSSLGPPRKD